MNNVAADYVFMLVAAVHPLIRISQGSKPTQLALVDVPVSPHVVEPVDLPAPPLPVPPKPLPSAACLPPPPPPPQHVEDDLAWCWHRPKDVWRPGNNGGDVA